MVKFYIYNEVSVKRLYVLIQKLWIWLHWLLLRNNSTCYFYLTTFEIHCNMTKLPIENKLNCLLLSSIIKFKLLNHERKEKSKRSNFPSAEKFSFNICMLYLYSAIVFNIRRRNIISKAWCDSSANLLPFVENWNTD